MTTVTNPVATPVSGKPNLLLGAFDIAELSYRQQSSSCPASRPRMRLRKMGL